MKNKYIIKLFSILTIIFVIFSTTQSNASVLDGGINWKVFIDDFTAQETYTISVPKTGGKIPKTRELCYQGVLSSFYFNSMRYYSVTISCEYKGHLVQITSMCTSLKSNKDVSYAFFALENDDKFNLTLMCEKK